MSITHLLNETVTQRREVRTPDGAGGTRADLAPIGTLAVRIPQPSTTERFYAEQPQAEHTQPIYADPDADLVRGDELVHADGRAWRVTAVLHPSKAKYVRADCELLEVRGE